MAWRENHGFCPAEAAGKRIKVKLRDGSIQGDKPVSATSPAGWPADGDANGRGPPIRWTLEGHRADVIAWDFL